jgi:hypothetical protein
MMMALAVALVLMLVLAGSSGVLPVADNVDAVAGWCLHC